MKVERIYVNPEVLALQKRIRELEHQNDLLNATIDDTVEEIEFTIEQLQRLKEDLEDDED